jgi:hypothetical protein
MNADAAVPWGAVLFAAGAPAAPLVTSPTQNQTVNTPLTVSWDPATDAANYLSWIDDLTDGVDWLERGEPAKAAARRRLPTLA